jgi:Zn-dependent M16 (insulinase) family peptidase
MNIYYTEDTLYINMEDEVNDTTINRLKKRVFGILNDYDINNIVLNIISNYNNQLLINDFVKEYHAKYSGNLIVR